MKEKNIIKVRKNPDGSFVQIASDGSEQPMPKGKTDWAALQAMTDAEIEAAALNDPDNPVLTKEELKKFQRTPNPKGIRNKLNMTQEEFARNFSLPLGTVRDWEQGAKYPDSAARTLLRVIAKNPQAVLQALKNQNVT